MDRGRERVFDIFLYDGWGSTSVCMCEVASRDTNIFWGHTYPDYVSCFEFE